MLPETEVCAAVSRSSLLSHGGRAARSSRSAPGHGAHHRLSIDAALARTELVVIGVGRLTPMPPGSQTTWLPLDGGHARVPRIRIRDGRWLVDGAPAALVNLSTLGAQVVSQVALKPRQRVRIVSTQPAAIKAAGTVIWASFEIPKGTQAPQSRRLGSWRTIRSRCSSFACNTPPSARPLRQLGPNHGRKRRVLRRYLRAPAGANTDAHRRSRSLQPAALRRQIVVALDAAVGLFTGHDSSTGQRRSHVEVG